MIPLIRPLILNLDGAQRLFSSAVHSGTLTNFGQIHEDLSRGLGVLSGGEALPIANGTAAIEVALQTQGLEPGDKVLVPDFTHSGTILAVVRAGFIPVLAGVDPKTWTLRPDEVEKAANAGLIDGVVVVSPFGYEVDTLAYEMIQDRTGMALVFDFAGSFGSFPRTLAPVCYSFHATKNFGVGEGGMIVFRSEKEHREAKRLINFGTLPNREIESLRGGNYKMDELKASYLLASLHNSHYFDVINRIETKKENLSFYNWNIPGTFVPPGEKNPSLCVLGNLPAEALEAASEREGMVFRRYYPLLSSMKGLASVSRLSESDAVMKNCCALPSDVDMSEALKVVEVVKKYL